MNMQRDETFVQAAARAREAMRRTLSPGSIANTDAAVDAILNAAAAAARAVFREMLQLEREAIILEAIQKTTPSVVQERLKRIRADILACSTAEQAQPFLDELEREMRHAAFARVFVDTMDQDMASTRDAAHLHLEKIAQEQRTAAVQTSLSIETGSRLWPGLPDHAQEWRFYDFLPETAKRGILEIAQERSRQITEEGWTAEHDDEHGNGELSAAAASYVALASHQCMPVGVGPSDYAAPASWPRSWADRWWKPSDSPIRNLQKAGAMIAAEIDRLRRIEQYERAEQEHRDRGRTFPAAPADALERSDDEHPLDRQT